MAGYTRQSTFADGDIIQAADFNDEYNQLVNAFDNTTGHSHDGTSGEGPVIGLIGDPGVATPINKVVVDDTNNRVGVFIDAGGLGSSVEQVRIQDGAVLPVTTNDIDVGSSSLKFKDGYFAGDVIANNISSTSYNSDIIPDTDDAYDLGSVTAEWKDLYLDGTANVDALVIGTATAVTDVDTDLTTVSASDDTLASAKAIKTYVDAQVTAQDLDFQADTGGALNIDLDSETLTLTGGTGIDTSGLGNTVTFAIDSTVATLTDAQTLTNKTIDVDNNTVSNIEVDNFKATAIVTEAEGLASSDNDTSLPTVAAVVDYVAAQITAEDLDVAANTGTAAVDLDSQSLTLTGGTGIDTSAAGQTVTFAIDSTVVTLNDTQTLTNKTLTTPVISSINNTGTLTLPTSTDTLIGRATTDTLTNKTLTSAVLDTGVSGTAILDEDNMASDSDTQLATQQSIKAYVDAQVTAGAGIANVVEDLTPQLGGTLDTNGQLIQFGDSSGATDDRLQLGDSQDMQLYHDGTNNKIDTAASQELHVNSDDVLFYDNSGTTRTAIVSPGSTMNFQLYDSTGTVRVFAVNGSSNEFHRSVYIQDQRSLGFKEDSANGSNYVAFQAPASVAANVTWTLPDADGTSGQFLQTNGSGTLSWADEADGSALAFAIALG